ncbi:hypothetical protein [Actinoplanes sp. NPDC051411]|uniref:hypothetical protein n=1 Tax=Actinoplanes sp. NPDC051411 TaxID=3155522 RepID=UPI0034195A23
MRQLSPETRAALVTLAQGSCQFPGCRTPILVFLGDDLEVNVEMVRIRDTDPAGPRYVAGTTARQRDSFANLLLLCVPHGRILDRDEKAHPIELIETWRTEVGDDLGPITPRRLGELLTTAFTAAREQVDEALTRFARTEPDAARLLGAVMGDLHRQRGRYGADRRLTSALTQVLDVLTEQPRRAPRPERVNVGWRSGRC